MALNIPPVSGPNAALTPTPARPVPTSPEAPQPLAAEQASPQPAPQQESLDVRTLPQGSTAPVVALMNETPNLKAHGEGLFASKFKATGKSVIKPEDPKLNAQLKTYHDTLEKNPEMKRAIGRNPRGLDFMHVLEKASKNQKLNRDDIQSLQLFLAKDTRFSQSLSYPGEAVGTDGKFGVRTLGTLDHFMNNFTPADLVADPYYQRLDAEGVKYAKLE